MLRQWIADNNYPDVLDVGAGQGICAPHVGDISYLGIDPSVPLIARAKERYSRPGVDFSVGNSYDTGLADASVSAAFSIGVWFHLEDLDRAHREMARVMKPNSGLLIITSNPDTHSLWMESFLDQVTEGKKVTGMSMLPTGKLSKDIFYLHKKEEILESLVNNGFTITNTTTFGEEGSIGLTGSIWLAIEARRNSRE